MSWEDMLCPECGGLRHGWYAKLRTLPPEERFHLPCICEDIEAEPR
ncbi:MAG: hypothetical protein AAGI34_07380 [Pseudomonadota bacterium]